MLREPGVAAQPLAEIAQMELGAAQLEPASLPIFDRSRMSLITVSSDVAEVRSVVRYPRLALVEPGALQQLGHADRRLLACGISWLIMGEELALGPGRGLGGLLARVSSRSRRTTRRATPAEANSDQDQRHRAEQHADQVVHSARGSMRTTSRRQQRHGPRPSRSPVAPNRLRQAVDAHTRRRRGQGATVAGRIGLAASHVHHRRRDDSSSPGAATGRPRSPAPTITGRSSTSTGARR